ncbi:hypothetical protein ZIOFF_008080 [Zingiber officinale]|uniref:Uncharacterized protein n=1 Tax=Zingiber officinale TaxID=94328 RepID=A0A8J5IEX1_ZINOF|nr:hypothetical protein ZIOFF_008080 [Zingiber officinale]
MVISNPSSSTIDPELVISHRFSEVLLRPALPRFAIQKDVALYALGIGTCSGDAVNEKELSYVYHKNGQKFIKILNQFKVAGLHDKGKATIIELETTSYIKESGEVLCMNRSSIYLRGSGGFSSASQPYSYKTYSDSQPSRFSIPKHQPTAIFEETTQLSQVAWCQTKSEDNEISALVRNYKLIGNTPLTNGGFGSLEFSKNSSGTTILIPLTLELRLLHLKTLPPLHLKTILLLLLYLSHLSLSLHFLSMTRSSSFTRVQQEFNLESRRQGTLVEKSLVDSLLACCRTKIHIVLHGGWKPRPSWLGNVVGRFVVLCSWFFKVLAVLQVVMVFWGRCQKHLALVVSRMLSWSREGLNRSCSRSLDEDLEGGRTWFARPILHGLCTLGFAVRAIIRSFCDGEATAVKNIFGRFLLHSYLSDKGEGAKSSCALWLCATEAELFPVESVPEIMMNMDYSFFKWLVDVENS